jgi:hypothetical protein
MKMIRENGEAAQVRKTCSAWTWDRGGESGQVTFRSKVVKPDLTEKVAISKY